MTIEIKTDYIKISQLLKLANIIGQGSDVKYYLENNKIIYEGVEVTQRGKKIYKNTEVLVDDFKIEVI